MANKLTMAVLHAVLGLLQKGWSCRKIARELGIHRETVGRYARNHSDDLSPVPPAGPGDGSKPASVTPGSLPPGHSQCEPFRTTILQKIEEGLEGVRIWQDLKSESGFTGSYSSVKRFIRRTGKTALPFRRMECAPGEEAQVDFGQGSWTLKDGKRRRPHVLRVVLSHSRKGFTIAVWRQTTENFIRCLERAFRHFGGVPKTIVLDNLKAAVTHADWFDPELNPKILAFQRHYGCVLLPAKPYTPRHKGKVESGVKYVQNNAVKGRLFNHLEEQNASLLEWEEKIADTRVHGTTRKQVRRLFEEAERPALLALPKEPFPLYEEGERKVHQDGHVEIGKSYYSVPPEYLGHKVWVSWDDHMVRIYHRVDFTQIALHVRALPGKFRTAGEHLSDKKISGVERGVSYLLSKAYRLGVDAGQWGDAMLEERGVEGIRVLQGLLSLSKRYPAQAIGQACRHALSTRCFRLRSLRELCKRLSEKQPAVFCQEDPLIRPLSEYGERVRVMIKSEPS